MSRLIKDKNLNVRCYKCDNELIHIRDDRSKIQWQYCYECQAYRKASIVKYDEVCLSERRELHITSG